MARVIKGSDVIDSLSPTPEAIKIFKTWDVLSSTPSVNGYLHEINFNYICKEYSLYYISNDEKHNPKNISNELKQLINKGYIVIETNNGCFLIFKYFNKKHGFALSAMSVDDDKYIIFEEYDDVFTFRYLMDFFRHGEKWDIEFNKTCHISFLNKDLDNISVPGCFNDKALRFLMDNIYTIESYKSDYEEMFLNDLVDMDPVPISNSDTDNVKITNDRKRFYIGGTYKRPFYVFGNIVFVNGLEFEYIYSDSNLHIVSDKLANIKISELHLMDTCMYLENYKLKTNHLIFEDEKDYSFLLLNEKPNINTADSDIEMEFDHDDGKTYYFYCTKYFYNKNNKIFSSKSDTDVINFLIEESEK